MTDSPYIFEGAAENFRQLVIDGSSERPVLVDFWAAWCGPCQTLLPIVAKLAEEYQGKFHLVKVNSDEQQALATQFGVRSLPTLKLFNDGKIVEEVMGVQPETVLREMLEQYIERESDQTIQQALLFAERHDLEQATALLTQAMRDDPGNRRIPPVLAQLTMTMGNPAEAENIIMKLPRDQRDSDEVKELRAQIRLAITVQGSPKPNELEQKIKVNPNDLESRHLLSAWQALAGDYESALQQLLEIMRKDRNWNEEAGRKGMLAILDLLPSEDELAGRYRRQMFNLLH